MTDNNTRGNTQINPTTSTPGIDRGGVRDTVVANLANHLNDPDVVEIIGAGIGPFSQVYNEPYEELGPLRRWVRDAAAEADRSVPALSSMAAVYEQLIAAEDNSGPPLRLANGVNVIGLDNQGRRWLIPQVSRHIAKQVAETSDVKSVERLLRTRGSVRFHWSVERTFLVPDATDIGDLLPLPSGGQYLVIYQGTQRIVTKGKFRDAITKLAKNHRVADLLVWDTTGDTPVLASVRANLAHSCGKDTTWSDVVGDAHESLQRDMWP